ncbi:MAG: hypothetical protein QOE28_1600, partial [Solirubrobacteraceae bacterium]|nr:hypothetical protein [Solirubrobacteraceae bacterium]
MQATVSAPAPRGAFQHGSAGRLEGAAAVTACLAASVIANARLLRSEVVSDDALVHQFWMRHWQDPGLFNDPLTTQLRRSVRYPDGYQALFWLATHAIDPIAFGEWLGIGLMALSGWLVFRIVREQEIWRPAAWIGAALFLSLVGIHRFAGGFPRAFVQPAVLLTVLLAMRGRNAAAAAVAGAAALFYPPAGVLAAGALALSAVRGWRIDVRRASFAGVAAAALLTAVLVPRLLAGGAPRVMSAAEARAFPEFGPHGTLPFFVGSLTRYLSQNRSGFDLRWAGSILVVAGLLLLVVRWRDVPRLAPEVLAMPVASLGAFALAQLVLFQLYLPHRYTYPLVAFFAIAVAVLLRPLWEADGRHRLAVLAGPAAVAAVAVFAFPLAPPPPPGAMTWIVAALAAGGAIAVALRRAPERVRTRAGAAATGVLLLVLILVLPNGLPRGTRCAQRPAIRYFNSLPKEAVVAGDPWDLNCVPVSAERAVVTSEKLAPSYEAAAFRDGRARMFADLRAVYGPSPDAITKLSTRYGATHLWIRRDAVPRGARWVPRQLPYGRFVHDLLREGEPASLRLPAVCRRWRRGPVEVYDIACVSS